MGTIINKCITKKNEYEYNKAYEISGLEILFSWKYLKPYPDHSYLRDFYDSIRMLYFLPFIEKNLFFLYT